MSKSDAKEWLKEVVELSYLYDFYGELLSDSARSVFEGYVLNDMTLAEISDETGISRQGVHDTMKRTVKKLQNYEEKLHLVEKFKEIKNDVQTIRELALSQKNGDESACNEIIRLSDKMIQIY
ncbi:MAG: YlxM family DNA-binding protein [Clostridiales bacterium]|nr:YlxM family DNA-binding protein [Clostridiales bacterium]